MTLNIAPQMRLTDIQAAFHKKFPFLKLAFFTKAHKEGESSHADFLISDRNKTVKDANSKIEVEKTLIFDKKTTVIEIENAFENNFGLHVQVFRKSGSVWLETSVTDSLTLEEQTEKAKESEWKVRPIAEPMDYREQE